MKVRIPACTTCGREETLEIESREIVEEKAKRMEVEEASLSRLLAKCIESGPEDSRLYRESTLRRLLAKAQAGRMQAQLILKNLDPA